MGKKKNKKQKHDGSGKVFIFVLRQRSTIKSVILEAGFIFLYEHTKLCVPSKKKKLEAINLLLKMKWLESEFLCFFPSQVLRDSCFLSICVPSCISAFHYIRISPPLRRSAGRPTKGLATKG